MRYVLASLVVALLLTPFVRADDDKKDKPKTAQEQFDAMMAELEASQGCKPARISAPPRPRRIRKRSSRRS